MSEVKDLTVGKIIAINRAISRVRDQRNMMGQTIPGCTLPVELMFLNAWTQNEISSIVEGFDDAQKAVRKKHVKTDKDGKEEPLKVKDLEKMEEELQVLLKAKADVKLKKFKLSDLKKIDSEDYLKINKDHPVPQEYFSLLMEAGLIEDDVNK